MATKEIGKLWFSYGKLNGFGIGFRVSKSHFDLYLFFWYIGLEY